IFNATVKGETPNDLLDKQDMLIGQMKNIAGVSVTKDKYGRAFVSLEGQDGQNIDIVSENTVNELEMTVEDNEEGKKHQLSVVTEEGAQPVEIKTGAIKGLQEALVIVDQKQEEVSTFIENFTSAVNLIHKGGENGEGLEFFTADENGK